MVKVKPGIKLPGSVVGVTSFTPFAGNTTGAAALAIVKSLMVMLEILPEPAPIVMSIVKPVSPVKAV